MNASLIAVNTVGGVGLCRPSAERVKKIGSKSVDRVDPPGSHYEDPQYQSEERLARPRPLPDLEGPRQIQGGQDWALHIPAGTRGPGHQVGSEEGGQDTDHQQEISQDYRGVH